MTPELRDEALGILRDVIFECRHADPSVGIYAREDLALVFESIAQNLDRIFVPPPIPGETLGDYFQRLTTGQQRAWEMACGWTHAYAEVLGVREDETLLQASERVVAERGALLRALQETHE